MKYGLAVITGNCHPPSLSLSLLPVLLPANLFLISFLPALLSILPRSIRRFSSSKIPFPPPSPPLKIITSITDEDNANRCLKSCERIRPRKASNSYPLCSPLPPLPPLIRFIAPSLEAAIPVPVPLSDNSVDRNSLNRVILYVRRLLRIEGEVGSGSSSSRSEDRCKFLSTCVSRRNRGNHSRE